MVYCRIKHRLIVSSRRNPTGKSKKKKWSKGKVKDKANNAVVLDKTTYDRVMKEVPTFRMISQSVSAI